MKIEGKRGGITVEALLVFPVVLMVMITMIFFIAEGRLEIHMLNAASKGCGIAVNEIYPSMAAAEGLKGIGTIMGEQVLGGGAAGGFAMGLLDRDGTFKRIGLKVLGRIVRKSTEARMLDIMEKAGYGDRYGVFLALPEMGSANTEETEEGEDVRAVMYQKEAAALGIFIKSTPLRITACRKSFLVGSANVEDWLERSAPSENKEIAYVTRTGECYHRGSCKESLDESCIPILLDAARLSGYRSCMLCKPD